MFALVVAKFLKDHPSVCSQLNRPLRIDTDLASCFARVVCPDAQLMELCAPYYRCRSGRLVNRHDMLHQLQLPQLPSDHIEVVRLLADAKADVSSGSLIKSEHGHTQLTPLMQAVLMRNETLTRALLEMRADPGVETSMGCVLRVFQPCPPSMLACVTAIRSSYRVSLRFAFS